MANSAVFVNFSSQPRWIYPEYMDITIIAIASQLSLLTMKTNRFDFTFLEYRPLRTFSRKQSASLLVQFYGGVGFPGKVTMKTPVGAAPLQWNTIRMFGIRMGFNWRYYFSGQKS